MGRLRRRLERYQPAIPQPQNQPQPELPIPVDYSMPSPEAYNEQQSALAQEYDRLQKRAEKYQKEIQAIEATNPHSLYKDIITKPSPKGKYPVTIMGRPLDMAKLENYLVYRISPRAVTTLMRYNDSLVRSETLGFGRRKVMKFKLGILWIVLGALAIFIIGYVLMTQDISGFFQGLFGGM